jgi:hypothetical protein
MSFNIDISVSHLIPLKPSGSERKGLEGREEAKQPIKKMGNKIVKILILIIAPTFSFTISLRCYLPKSSLFISRLTTLTISKSSPLVNIPFSMSNLVRVSCRTTRDMGSSLKEIIYTKKITENFSVLSRITFLGEAS